MGEVEPAAEAGRATAAPGIGHEASHRIAQLVRGTLQRELARRGRHETSVGGAWNMLAAEGAGWSTRAHLDRGLYAEIRGCFSDDVVREVLLAAADVKLSRTCLSDAELAGLQRIAARHGVVLRTSDARYVQRRDTGKGGTSNRMERADGPDDGDGVRCVYIGADATVAESGRVLEEAGDDEIFGTLLGIPSCCREAYGRFKTAALAKQGDFVTLVLGNTEGSVPYDPRLNYVAQYFGRSLLSFFPCSFRCPRAARVAAITSTLLAGCDVAWARSFLALQRTNILYTEYEGVHLFRRPFANGSIEYGPQDVESTERTAVADLLRRGSRLEIEGRQRVSVYRGRDRLGVLEGEDIGICVFW